MIYDDNLPCPCGNSVPQGDGKCRSCGLQLPLSIIKARRGLSVDIGLMNQNPVFVLDAKARDGLTQRGYPNVLVLGDLVVIDEKSMMIKRRHS